MTAKRLLDLTVAGVGMVLLAPLFLPIAIWIKIDSRGPVIFRQERVGQFGRLFQILKFRSMVVRPASDGSLLTVGADRRVTRAGQFLRRYKMDELPQLINVVRGDMSLVGPRPEVPKYVALYSEDERNTVLSVRPGITDPASIMFASESELLGRSDDPELTYVRTILPQKLHMYQEYVRTRSFLGDILLVMRTVGVASWGSRRLGGNG